MAKVLITGGAGFIGQRLTQHCLNQGLEVRVFDLVRTNNTAVKESLTGSILDPYEVSRALRGCDYVIHAAAALGVGRTETQRLECLYINIQGAVNVLDAAVKERIKKILFTSSSEVYGDVNKSAVVETSPLNPKSNYAITKLVGEEYLRAYRQSYGLDYTVVRFFSVYGEGQSEQFVIPKFVYGLQRDQAPTLYGDGQQLRAFCHVDDAARGAIMALVSPKSSEQTYNIGNDNEPITISDIANLAIEVSGKKLKPEIVKYQSSDRTAERDIYFRIPSIEKAKSELGYKPQISIREGLKRMFEGATREVAV